MSKKRTKNEMAQWHSSLIAVLQSGQPMTLRRLFYQCVVRGLVEKTENSYTTLSAEFVRMRDEGRMPFGWMADFTRYIDEPLMFGGPDDALAWLSDVYKLDPWSETDGQLQVWVEKEAQAGIRRGNDRVSRAVDRSEGFPQSQHHEKDGGPCFIPR
jgi:hypothetical protein